MKLEAHKPALRQDDQPVAVYADPAPESAVALLVKELGTNRTVAQTLVRRGLADPVEAGRFIAASTRHSLSEFPGLLEAAEQILRAVTDRKKIIVHGDYDCDGVCSTAILVRTLRQLGADCSWFIPHRIDDGYGLASHTLERFAQIGVQMVITVDCGITAVEQAVQAKELGIGLVVTDHHQPRADGVLPACTIVHPGIAGYPCPELCGAGVAWTLANALMQASGNDLAACEIDLDLVALATIADVVPLIGENRTLVKQGLQRVRGASRPGMAALLDVASVRQDDVNSTSVAFRLAPRVNAAGRIGNASVGVELFLEADADRARELAQRLDQFNYERRAIESTVERQAIEQVAEMGQRDSYVLVSEGWHQGVVGIVASRIVDQVKRPVIVLASDGEVAAGSGRAPAGVSLLKALQACDQHLLQYGGHQVAAGLKVSVQSVAEFAEALEQQVSEQLAVTPIRNEQKIDAVVGGSQLDMSLANSLDQLEPFGAGNQQPLLYSPHLQIDAVRPLGKDGKHLAFRVASGNSSVEAVAFGIPTIPASDDGLYGATFAFEVSRFKGSAVPRARINTVFQQSASEIEFVCPDEEEICRLVLDQGPKTFSAATYEQRESLKLPSALKGFSDNLAGDGQAAAITSLVMSGENVLVVCSDQRKMFQAMQSRVGGFTLIDWWTLTLTASDSPKLSADHLVLLDPPSSLSQAQSLALIDARFRWKLFSGSELDLANRVVSAEDQLRASASELYRFLQKRTSSTISQLFACDEWQRTGWWTGLVLGCLQQVEAVKIDLQTGAISSQTQASGPLESSQFYGQWQTVSRERLAWLTSLELAVTVS